MCKVSEIGDYEVREAYIKLWKTKALKVEHKHIANKGLVCALDFSHDFKIEWIKIGLAKLMK